MKRDNTTKFEQLEQRAFKSYNISEVYEKNLISSKTLNFLESQSHIPINNILNIIKVSKENNLPIGYIMKHIDKDSIVGFVGTLFVKKRIKNNDNFTCNIHSWIVHKKHRLYSFFLISKILKKNYQLTAFTPVLPLKGLLTKLGFEKESIYEKFLLNLFPIYLKKKKFEISKLKKINGLIEIEFTNKDSSTDILLIGSLSKKKRIKIFKILSINNINLFKDNFSEIIDLISKKLDILFFSEYLTNEDENFMPSLNIFSLKKKREIYVKSPLKLSKIDFFNSDLAF